MMHDRLGPQAQRVYDVLHERIVSGVWASGVRLPAHAELARELGVAVMTVRQALSRLEQEGSIRCEQGRGTFVQRTPLDTAQAGALPLETLVNAAPLGVVTLDSHGNVLSWNAVVEDIYGWTAQEVLGKPHPGVPEAELDDYRHVITSVLATRTTHSVRARRRHKSGDWREVSVSIAPLLDAGDTPVGAVALVVDMTGHTQATQELAAAERRFRATFEGAALGIGHVSLDGRWLLVNDHLCQMVGYTAEELLAQRFHDITHPDDRDLHHDDLQRLLRGEVDSYTLEKRYLRKDGTEIWVHPTASLVRKPDGSPDYIVTIIEDITERKCLAEALRESQERFESAFRYAAIGKALVDLDGHWLKVNHALCQLVGYDEDELLRLTFQDLTHPDDLDTDLAYVQEMLAGTRSTYQMEKRYVHRQGHVVWVLLTVSLVHDAAGAPLYFISEVQDITARKRAEELLRHQALHDPLTGLANRTLLLDQLEEGIRKAGLEDDPLTLLLMDLDNFKEINDTFGHPAGDELLAQLGGRLHAALLDMDTVARLGGDEFAMVLPSTSVARAITTARRLLAALDEPFVVRGQGVSISASMGIALFPDHGADAATLLRRADVAMYTAKRSRSGYAVFTPDQDQHTPDRLSLMGELRNAIERNQLVLHFQPQVDLRSGGVVGVEALLRWMHPVRGLIMPDAFIELAEHSGLIKPLSVWVLNAALHHQRQWREAGLDLPVAVNLSPRNLQDPDTLEAVTATLRLWQAQPGALKIEVTESAIHDETGSTLHVLRQLHEMGVEIAIDDFGAGFSSLGRLRRMPVQEIKIDRSFVVDMLTETDNAFIVRAIVDLGHNLGLRVVAEGIEDQRTCDLLSVLNCDAGQGYLLAKPMPAAELMRWLRGKRLKLAA